MHKYQVVLVDATTGYLKTVKFGAQGYSDFTQHHDEARKQKYITRHKAREDWTKAGVASAGFWAKHILWNKPTVTASWNDVVHKYFKRQA